MPSYIEFDKMGSLPSASFESKVVLAFNTSGSLSVIDNNGQSVTVGNASPNYKVYTALLSQSGTDAPVATVLENTLGGDVTYTYTSTGSYVITLPSYFSNIWVSLTSNNAGSNGILEYDINSFPTSTITLQSNEFTEDSPANINLADNVLYLASIEIRIYD